jgi:hypothetical protein
MSVRISNSSSIASLLNSVPRKASAKAAESVIKEVSNTSFRNRLEDYLDKYEKGIPQIGNTIPSELRGRQLDSNLELLQSDIKARVDFGAYSTAMTKYQKARFVAGVNETSDLSNTLVDAKANAEAESNKILESYGLKAEA